MQQSLTVSALVERITQGKANLRVTMRKVPGGWRVNVESERRDLTWRPTHGRTALTLQAAALALADYLDTLGED